jgi:hypothetical protein
MLCATTTSAFITQKHCVPCTGDLEELRLFVVAQHRVHEIFISVSNGSGRSCPHSIGFIVPFDGLHLDASAAQNVYLLTRSSDCRHRLDAGEFDVGVANAQEFSVWSTVCMPDVSCDCSTRLPLRSDGPIPATSAAFPNGEIPLLGKVECMLWRRRRALKSEMDQLPTPVVRWHVRRHPDFCAALITKKKNKIASATQVRRTGHFCDESLEMQCSSRGVLRHRAESHVDTGNELKMRGNSRRMARCLFPS